MVNNKKIYLIGIKNGVAGLVNPVQEQGMIDASRMENGKWGNEIYYLELRSIRDGFM
jgi:hypothetical protein